LPEGPWQNAFAATNTAWAGPWFTYLRSIPVVKNRVPDPRPAAALASIVK
jgi:hypothetical protein